MKKIIYSVLMMATMAFTLTSCEDVPLPYGWPFANGGGDDPTEVPVDAQGTGTVDDPYNVAAALHLISTLGADVNSDNVWNYLIAEVGSESNDAACTGMDVWHNADFTIGKSWL